MLAELVFCTICEPDAILRRAFRIEFQLLTAVLTARERWSTRIDVFHNRKIVRVDTAARIDHDLAQDVQIPVYISGGKNGRVGRIDARDREVGGKAQRLRNICDHLQFIAVSLHIALILDERRRHLSNIAPVDTAA